jgi:hypothetical protein
MAGSKDCIMSFSKWQKLIATITLNTVPLLLMLGVAVAAIVSLIIRSFRRSD